MEKKRVKERKRWFQLICMSILLFCTHKQHISHFPFIAYSYVIRDSQKTLSKNFPSLLLLSDSKLSQFDIILIWKSFSLTVSNTPFFQGVMALIVRVCVCAGICRQRCDETDMSIYKSFSLLQRHGLSVSILVDDGSNMQ